MFNERPTATPIVGFVNGNPKVYILPIAIAKMQEYVRQSNKEIGWLGTVERIKNQFIITDVMLFKQEVAHTTCEITTQGLAEFGQELLALENGMEIINNIRAWGHSHVNMGVGPSGQDDFQMKEFGQMNIDYMLRLICNKSGEMEIALWDYATGITYKNIPWRIYTALPNVTDMIKAEITAKVSNLTYQTQGYIGLKKPVIIYPEDTDVKGRWVNGVFYSDEENNFSKKNPNVTNETNATNTQTCELLKKKPNPNVIYEVMESINDLRKWFILPELYHIGKQEVFIDAYEAIITLNGNKYDGFFTRAEAFRIWTLCLSYHQKMLRN